MGHKPHLRLVAVSRGGVARPLNRRGNKGTAAKLVAETRPFVDDKQLVTTLVVLFVGAMSGFIAAALLGLTTLFTDSFETKLSERLANSPAFRAAVMTELQKSRTLESTETDQRRLDGKGFAREESGKPPVQIQGLTMPSDRR